MVPRRVPRTASLSLFGPCSLCQPNDDVWVRCGPLVGPTLRPSHKHPAALNTGVVMATLILGFLWARSLSLSALLCSSLASRQQSDRQRNRQQGWLDWFSIGLRSNLGSQRDCAAYQSNTVPVPGNPRIGTVAFRKRRQRCSRDTHNRPRLGGPAPPVCVSHSKHHPFLLTLSLCVAAVALSLSLCGGLGPGPTHTGVSGPVPAHGSAGMVQPRRPHARTQLCGGVWWGPPVPWNSELTGVAV